MKSFRKLWQDHLDKFLILRKKQKIQHEVHVRQYFQLRNVRIYMIPLCMYLLKFLSSKIRGRHADVFLNARLEADAQLHNTN